MFLVVLRFFFLLLPGLFPSHSVIFTPPTALVLRISHSGSLPRRPPPRPVLRISHSDFLTRQAPPPSPSHFPLQFFNPSIPPRLVLHISHFGSLTRRSPRPVLHISHSNSLTFRFRFLRTQHEQKNRRFLSFQQPCQVDGFRGRTTTSLLGSLTLSLF
jgi:hypothetical protein